MRDAAPWVGSAWRSLVRQTYGDWRLVAVDDGSSDGSAEVLTRAAAGDQRLHLVTQPATGVAAALNCGLREVAAPLVVRMDADDVCHPRRLELLTHGLEKYPEVGVLASRVRLFPGRRVSPAMTAYLDWQNGLLDSSALRRERFVECTVTHATAVFRTGVLEAAGGWWEGPGPEDLDLFLRLHRTGVAFAKRPEVLYLWREHPDRETRTSPRMSGTAFRRTKATHLAAELRASGQYVVALFGTGDSLAGWRDELQGRGVVVDPRPHGPAATPPTWEGQALFCFGSPKVRQRLRESLAPAVEGDDFLFVA